jgi:hypothetical protein
MMVCDCSVAVAIDVDAVAALALGHVAGDVGLGQLDRALSCSGRKAVKPMLMATCRRSGRAR